MMVQKDNLNLKFVTIKNHYIDDHVQSKTIFLFC